MGDYVDKRSLMKRDYLTFRPDLNDSFTRGRWELAEDNLRVHIQSISPLAMAARQAQHSSTKGMIVDVRGRR